MLDLSQKLFGSILIALFDRLDLAVNKGNGYKDMQKIAHTISTIAYQGHFPKYIDGKGGYVFDYEITAGMWIYFAKYDKRLYKEVVKLLFKNSDSVYQCLSVVFDNSFDFNKGQIWK